MRYKRSGVALAFAVIVMGVMAWLLAGLVLFSAAHNRDLRAERVRSVARAVMDSSAAYAQANIPAWTSESPAEPVVLDIRPLLPPQMSGFAGLAVVTVDEKKLCRITTSVSCGPYVVADELELPMTR